MAMSKVENLLELFQEEKAVGILSFLTIQNGLSGYVPYVQPMFYHFEFFISATYRPLWEPRPDFSEHLEQ